MLLCRIKRNDRFEKTKLLSGRHETFTWDGCTYRIDPTKEYKTRYMGIKLFALDYSKGNPNPIDYFHVAEGEAGLDFQLTPDLVAETYRKIIEGLNLPILILVCVIISIVVAGVSGYLSYDAGQKLGGIEAVVYRLYNMSQVPVVP